MLVKEDKMFVWGICMKRILAFLTAVVLTAVIPAQEIYAHSPGIAVEVAAAAESNAGDGPVIQAPSAILMEASTGTVIYEKNADEARNPASVTKIMTLLLTFDALKAGKTYCAALNAANEVAVAAFLEERIAFCDISDCLDEVLQRHVPSESGDLESIIRADEEARRMARHILEV